MAQDIGRLVGRYFRVLAWLDIAMMILTPLLFDAFYLDLTFILCFWAAACLIEHSRTAWKWVVGITGVHLALGIGLFIYVAIVGPDRVPLEIGGRPVEDSSWPMVLLLPGLITLLSAIPFTLLLTPQARREFAGETPTDSGANHA